jgi:hypothetical protein
MPMYYKFFKDGEQLALQRVDDMVREIMGLPIDHDEWSDWYNTLTWAVLTYGSFDDMIAAASERRDMDMEKMARGLRALGITYVSGRA